MNLYRQAACFTGIGALVLALSAPSAMAGNATEAMKAGNAVGARPLGA